MKKYFEIGEFYVTDFRDKKFASYQINNQKGKATSRVFNDFGESVMYCIALFHGSSNDRVNTVMIEAFNRMIKQPND